MKPIIIINFKLYAFGGKALQTAKNFSEISGNIIIAPPLLDLTTIAKNTRLPVFSQHADAVEEGAHTGHISVKHLKQMGIKGTLINHAEKPVKDIEPVINLCRKYKLTSVVCARSLNEVAKIKEFKPDYIAYEPPELIGGKRAVTDAKPDVIRKAVKIANKVKILVGAGIKSARDVRTALRLGAKGVLISSGIMLAKSPVKELKAMAQCVK